MANNQNAKTSSINITKYIEKRLKSEAKYCEDKVKLVLRDKLEAQHKHDIYASYAPIQISGKQVKNYNKDPYITHRKKLPYHHTGLLIRSVRGVINGKIVSIELDPLVYEDGTSVNDVYEWLDKGTKETDYYVYILGGKGSHTPYVGKERTPKHGFRKATMDNIQNYIKNELIPDIRKGRYKLRKGAR